MAKYVSRKNPVSVAYLKRKQLGTVAMCRYGRVDVRFTRLNGGWMRERTDVTSERPDVVSSADVARECNSVVGCESSWAWVY